MAEKVKRPLFTRLLVAMVALFLLLSASVSIVFSVVLKQNLEAEYKSKSLAIAETLSDELGLSNAWNDLGRVQEQLNQMKAIAGVHYIIIRNEKGEALAHTFSPAIPHYLSKSYDQLNLRTKSFSRSTLVDNHTVLEAISPILSGELGVVIVGMDLSVIAHQINVSLAKILSVIIALFFGVSALLFVGARRISKPLRTLTEYARVLARSEFKDRVPFRSMVETITGKAQDEIGQLALSFGNLEDQLIGYIHELKVTTLAKEKIESELVVANAIQQSMLSDLSELNKQDMFEVAGRMIPAKSVGGDFYDCFYADKNSLCFIVGDVSGSGVPAAMLMTQTMTLFQSIAKRETNVSEIMTLVNRQVSINSPENHFVSVFFGKLNCLTGELEYSNAGRIAPLIARGTQIKELSLTNGVAMGMEPRFFYQTHSFKLQQNDLICAVTDGILDAKNADNSAYGTQRLSRLFLEQNTQHLARSLCKDIVEDVQQFIGGELQDDITLLILHWKSKSVFEQTELSVHFDNNVNELKKLQYILQHFGQAHELPNKLVMDANLILEELLTNTIYYAYRDHNLHQISLKMTLSNTKLQLVISDDGVPFDPTAVEKDEDDDSLDDRQIGGLGIHLVKSLSQSLHYERKDASNIVSIGLTRPKPSSA
ncbi:MAG: SpoIIE family protein phosphatase [bacterium]|nr:SpoIIE family protein phosphatase [bacterium]